MRILLFLCIIAITGCTTSDVRVPQDPQVSQLQYEVRALKGEVAEMSKKLDKTSKTAVSANVRSTKNAAKVEDVKHVADKAADTALDAVLDVKDGDVRSPVPEQAGKKSVILKPREINHETSLFPE